MQQWFFTNSNYQFEIASSSLRPNVHYFQALAANTIARSADKAVQLWNLEHYSWMRRGKPGFGGVLPNEIARSRIAAWMSKIEVASMVGPESYEPIFFRKQDLVCPVRKSQYMQQSLHLLPRHKNSIHPLERWELERSLGDPKRNRWKWNHQWISSKLTMHHRTRLVSCETIHENDQQP